MKNIMPILEFICIFVICLVLVLVIDSQIAGISGDMLLSSLVDIGASKQKIIGGVKASQNFLPGSKIKKIDFKKANKKGVRATLLALNLEESRHERKGTEIKSCIKKTAKKIGLSRRAEEFAVGSISTLIKAESTIHGVPEDSVHFHEASSIDTVIDIVGCAIALDDLKLFDHQIIATPVAVGSGTVTFSHGTVSNPAGAILEIFKRSGIMICGSAVKEELTTPTGASMLVNLAERCSQFYPVMEVGSVGYGAGQKNLEGLSNVLKITVGKMPEFEHDRVSILETNVDDVSGEVLSHTIERLMSAGAKDVTVVPALTKKGRPSHIISVMCEPRATDGLANILALETGTLGIRVRSSERLIVGRRIDAIKVRIRGRTFTVRYKTTKTNRFKVEYEDVKKVSEKLGIPLGQTEELIREQVKTKQ